MDKPVIKYGLELEFASSVPRKQLVQALAGRGVPLLLSHDRITPDYDNCWYLGTDSSVTPDKLHGYELRSVVFTEFPFQTLSTILRYLKSHNCWTTTTAGLHFHFSGVYLSQVKINILTKLITALKIPKQERKSFCLRKKEDIKELRDSKYVPINFIGINHYECRVFNSTFKLRGIYHNWLTLCKLIETAGYTNPIDENHDDYKLASRISESITVWRNAMDCTNWRMLDNRYIFS